MAAIETSISHIELGSVLLPILLPLLTSEQLVLMAKCILEESLTRLDCPTSKYLAITAERNFKARKGTSLLLNLKRSFYPQCEEATAGVKILDGKLIAQQLKQENGESVNEMRLRMGFVPRLALIEVIITHFPDSAALHTVLRAIQVFNSDMSIHGIVVQHPLPKKMRPECLLQNISLEKDVDGLHPMNLKSLALEEYQPSFVPCTSRACLELLRRYNFQPERRRAVVIGCSNVVGLPTALLLQRLNATVTIVDKHTPSPAEVTNKVDILISATGNANLVRGHWIKPGAVVIDVGMNIVEDPCLDEGFKFVGDVCFEEAEKVRIGPITIAMVLYWLSLK